VEKTWPGIHNVILGIKPKMGWEKEEELPRETSPTQYRENLTPSDLWPQPFPHIWQATIFQRRHETGVPWDEVSGRGRTKL
jgi:hypothetical protein